MLEDSGAKREAAIGGSGGSSVKKFGAVGGDAGIGGVVPARAVLARATERPNTADKGSVIFIFGSYPRERPPPR